MPQSTLVMYTSRNPMKMSRLLFSGVLAFLHIGKAMMCRKNDVPSIPTIEKKVVLNRTI